MKLAMVFPGQGSQSVGMMAGYLSPAAASVEGIVRETFTEASDALGQDLWALASVGPAETLNLTLNTQPVMLAAGVAAWRVTRALGVAEPAVLAGHSLGEYSALVCGGALDFADAVRLVRVRAEAMQSAVPEGAGAMAAILGLDDDAVRAVCLDAAAGDVLEAVNYNAPGQVVIAGQAAAVERACGLAKERGAKRALPLPVSVPSHCALMRPAAERLLAALQDMAIRAPLIPVIHNADVALHAEPEAIRDALARQLYSPVRWVESMRAMAAQGVTRIAECGPGKVLAGLNKRILDDVPTLALASADAIAELAGVAPAGAR